MEGRSVLSERYEDEVKAIEWAKDEQKKIRAKICVFQVRRSVSNPSFSASKNRWKCSILGAYSGFCFA